MNNMQDWIQEESEALELERQEAMEKNGQIGYWKVPQGLTVIEVLVEYPAVTSQFGEKKEIHILVDGVEKKWTVPKKVYRDLIEHLKLGKIKFQVIRIGTEKKDTRYDLVAL